MKREIFVVTKFIWLVIICLINHATTINQTIFAETTGASFLEIGIGARPIGMGSAFTAISDDISAIHYNPAGLVQLQRREISAMHSEWLVDTKLDFIGFSFPLPPPPIKSGGSGAKSYTLNPAVIGGSVIYLAHSEIEKRDETRQKTGTFNASDLAITLSYSK